MDKLNESACSYLDDRPVDKEFSRLNDQVTSKIDSLVGDLEQQLTHTLSRNYPKHVSMLSVTASNNRGAVNGEQVRLQKQKQLDFKFMIT
jgi:chemotaxis regulatin CheY-phosphate phosphatase CheZ